MGRFKCDHIKQLITLASDNIKWLSLYIHVLTQNFRSSDDDGGHGRTERQT